MKSVYTVLIVFSIYSVQNLEAQIAINNDGSSAAVNSVLHIKGDNNGTPVEAMFIDSPTGNIGIGTITPGFVMSFKDGGGDKISFFGQSGTHYGIGIGSYLMQFYSQNTVSDIVFGYGRSNSFTELMRITGTGQVGIGTSSPDNSAALEILSTDQGLLLPTFTQAQMEALSSPAAGTHIYNTDLKVLCVYNGTKWDCMDNQSVFSRLFECGDKLIDYRDSTEYNTVEIGSQCWMAENLNLGTRIDIISDQSDNGIIEKYCYNDDENRCDVYGALYLWNELMQYTTSQASQGICPFGWHIPTDNEWKTLEMYLGMSQTQANATGFRGNDEGGSMKETGTAHWNTPNTGATNSSGFTGLAGGYRANTTTVNYLYVRGFWWTSTLGSGLPIIRRIDYDSQQVSRSTSNLARGRSVRCLKD